MVASSPATLAVARLAEARTVQAVEEVPTRLLQSLGSIGDRRKGRIPSDADAAFITVPADRKPLPGA